MSRSITRNTAASNSLRIMSSVLAAMLFTICLITASNAQSSTDGTTPLGLAPGSPTGSYALSDFDVVNLYNGGLNFRLPLYQVAGRGGAAYPITLHVQKKWTVYRYFEPAVGYFYYADAGWWSEEGAVLKIFEAGRVDLRTGYREQPTGFPVEGLTRVTFTAPDGTEYELRDQLTNGQPKSPVSGGFNRGTIFVTADGTTATFVSDWDIHEAAYGLEPPRPDGYLMLRDGTRFRVDDGTISWMRDRNGNRVTFGYDFMRRVTSITDSLNRQLTIVYSTQTTGFTQINYKGFGGSPRTIKIGQTNLANALRADYSPQNIGQLFPELHGGGPVDSTVINYIELPDGRTYELRYNPYAELARVVLPTGGAIEYDHAAGLTDGSASGVFTVNDTPSNKYIYRRVIERRIYPDGGSGSAYESKMTYSRPETTTSNLGYVITEQRSANGSLLSKSQHYFHGSPRASFSLKPTHYPAWKDGREYKTELFDINGSTILKRIEHTFAQREPVIWWGGTSDTAPPNDPRTTETVMTLEPATANLVSKQTFGFDDTVPFNNQNNFKEYNFGTGSAGTLARETRTTFVTSSTYTDNAVHLRSLPSRVSTYDGAGTERARTTYEYDNYTADSKHAALTDRANISGFDSSFGTGYTTRGNATASTKYLLVSGSVTGSVFTYSQFDIAGNVIKSIDGRGYAGEFFYTDCFGAPDGEAQTSTDPIELGSVAKTFAYVTEVKNALNQRTYTQFDYYLGQPVDGKDANGVVASGYFNDSLDRPKEIRRAVGTSLENRTVFNYDDTLRVITTTSDRDTNNDGILVTRQLYDRMGRTKETRQFEGNGNYIATRTEHDALGRAYKISNPFRPWQSQTPVWTTEAFDGLGRVISVTTPDGAILATAYSGDRVLVTDQIGKQRISRTNALDQLTDVWEITAPDSATEVISFPLHSEVIAGYRSTYEYDVLDNLTKVTQGSQTRTFDYDAIKRLKSATNPENGTVGYEYDNNANLLVKTDARGVSVHYEYDGLNRLKRRWYNGSSLVSDTTHNSPALPSGVGTTDEAKLYYDSQTLPTGSPFYAHGAAIGRLVAQTYGISSNGDYYAYDELGRQTLKIQQTGTINYRISAAYNLTGALTSMTYPSGHTISNSFDDAGRLITFSGNLGDGPSRTYTNEILYSPFGSQAKEKFGTTTPIYNKLFYNVRGQLAEIRESTSYTGPFDYSADRGAIINNYSDQCSGICSGSSMTDNNGNLKKQEMVIPGYPTRWQQYDYDSLNRLKWAREVVSGVEKWKQQFIYDRWGNRTLDTANTWGTAINNKAFTVDPSKNQLGVPSGQSGVMTYDTAGNLTTDTYTGKGIRTYNAENKMTWAWGKNDQAQLYSYDASGQRTKRTVDGVETWQVYGFGGELLAEYAANGVVASLQKEYGYRNGQLLVTAEPGGGSTAANVQWKNVVNLNVLGNSLTKPTNGNVAWDAGAVSTEVIVAGDGYMEFTASETNTNRMAGLSNGDSNQSYADIDFAIYLYSDGNAYVFERGINKGGFGSYSSGDIFRVAVESGVVKYRKNGALLYTSTVTPTYPLLVDTAISIPGGTLNNVRLSGTLVENVQWTTAVNVTVSGNSLIKPSNGNVAWDAGAVSIEAIASGDGYVEFTASESNTNRMAGLSNGDSNQSYADIDFAVYLYSDGNAYVFEGGVNKGGFGGYSSGDIFRVAVESGVVKYRKNGTLLYTSTATPTYPLLVDTAISIPGGTLNNVKLSGALVGGAAKINWLVKDQLGTPRMIFDQSGSLSNMKRHDYLPFGEELVAPAGDRSAAEGYEGGDGMRQQFSQKERDIETNLDYFDARYYASTQGRFISPDPLMASAVPANPQSFNRYTYVSNSPLTLIDPTGMFGISPGGSSLGGGMPFGNFEGAEQVEEQQPAQQPRIPIDVGEPPPPLVSTITIVVPDPIEYINEPMSDGTFFTGVASNLEITAHDIAGNPITGILVAETVVNVQGTLVRQRGKPGPVRPDGSFPDLVGVGLDPPPATPISQQQATDILSRIAVKPTDQVTIQTLRFYAPAGYMLGMAVIYRQFTNLDANSNVKPTTNKSGRPVDNYSIKVRLLTMLPPEK